MAVPASAYRAPAAGANALPALTPEEEQSFLSQIGSTTLSGLSGIGNLLDLPGSMVRDTLSTISGNYNNPFDQLLSPFTSQNRTGGRDLLEDWGLLDPNMPGLDFGDVAGFGLEVGADPFSFLTLPTGALGKAGQLYERAGILDDLMRQAAPEAGKRVGRMQTTFDDLLPWAKAEGHMPALEHAAQGMGYQSFEDASQALTGQSIGGLMGYGIPFMEPAGAFGTGKLAQKVAGGLDWAGEAMRYGEIPGTDFSPGRTLGAMFDYDSRGTHSRYAQEELAPLATKAEMEADAQAMGEFADDVELFHKEFISKAQTPDEKIQLYRDLNGAFETGQVPEYMQAMAPTVAKHRQLMDETLKLEQTEGLTTQKAKEIYDEYSARRMNYFEGRGKGAGRGNKILSGKHSSQIPRQEILTNLSHPKGGTYLLDELSLDEELSGIAHELPPAVLNDPKFWDQQTQKLADKMATMGIDKEAQLTLRNAQAQLEAGQTPGLTDELLDALKRSGVSEGTIKKYQDSAAMKQVLADLNSKYRVPFNIQTLKDLDSPNTTLGWRQIYKNDIKPTLDEAAKAAGYDSFDLVKIMPDDEATKLVSLLEKKARRSANVTYEHHRELAKWLANLDPRHARYEPGTEIGRIPVFAKNPIEMAIMRRSLGLRHVKLAQLVREEIGLSPTFKMAEAPIGGVRASELVSELGLEPQRTLDLIHEQYGGRAASVERAGAERFKEYEGGFKSSHEANRAEAERLSVELGKLVQAKQKSRVAREVHDASEAVGYDVSQLDAAVEQLFKQKMDVWNDPYQKGVREWRNKHKHLIPRAQNKDVDSDTIARYFDETYVSFGEATGDYSKTPGELFEILKGKDVKPRKKDPALIAEAEDMLRQSYQPKDLGPEIDEFADEAGDISFDPSQMGDELGDDLSFMDELGEGEQRDPDLMAALTDPKTGKQAQAMLQRLEELGVPYKEFKADWSKAPHEAAQEAKSDVLKSLNDVWVDKELAADLKEVIENFKSPKYVEDLLTKVVDPLNRLWQASVTRVFPAFHMRNHIAGQVVNKIMGAFSVKSYSDVWNLLYGRDTSHFSKIPMFKGLSEKEAASKFAKLAFAHKIYTKEQGMGLEGLEFTKLNKEIGATIPGVVPHSPLDPLKKLMPDKYEASTLQQMNPFNAEQFTPFKAGAEVGQQIEASNRLTAFAELLRKGWSPAKAAEKVRAGHIDYKMMTKAEKGVFKRLIPFYAFSKGMAKFTFDELSARPGGLMAQFGIRAPNQAREEGRPLPEYIAQTAAIPLGADQETGVDKYLTGLGLSHEDPLSFLSFRGGMPDLSDTTSEFISRMSPLIKYPIEAATGESFFQRGPLGGRELVDMDPTLGRLAVNLGLNSENASGRADPIGGTQFENLVANSPAARLLTTARTLTDDRKGWGQTALQLGTGIRTSDISPAARDAILRDEATAQMRELGAKTWEQTVFNKAQVQEAIKEGNTDLALEMIKFNRLQKYLQGRSKERKKAKEKARP